MNDIFRMLSDALTQAQWPGQAMAMERFEAYHALLTAQNRLMDLTNVPDDEMPERHYLDSIRPVLLDSSLIRRGETLLDVGSGAGLPGVPLAILMPEQAICLLEANSRRCDFLRSVLERLALPHASVLESRAETAGQDPRWRERFDITVSRAVAALPELLEYMLPLTRPGGRALCWKGRKAQEELTAARPAAQKLGDARLTLLPFGAEQDSCLIIADKQGPTPAQYPRRNGIPHKRPIL